MEQVIYEDKPRTDTWIKSVVWLPSIIMAAAAVPLMYKSLDPGIYMLCAAAAVGLVLYFLVIPTGYVIYNDKISVRFRGPLAFNMPFATLTGVRKSRWSTFGVNLPTNISQADAVEIVRKRRLAVTITPGDKQAFITNFEKVFKEWQKFQQK
jgi:hypothetical protein